MQRPRKIGHEFTPPDDHEQENRAGKCAAEEPAESESPAGGGVAAETAPLKQEGEGERLGGGEGDEGEEEGEEGVVEELEEEDLREEAERGEGGEGEGFEGRCASGGSGAGAGHCWTLEEKMGGKIGLSARAEVDDEGPVEWKPIRRCSSCRTSFGTSVGEERAVAKMLSVHSEKSAR